MKHFLFLALSILLLLIVSPHLIHAEGPPSSEATDQTEADPATEPLEVPNIEQVALDPCVDTGEVKASKCINLSIGSVVAKVVQMFFVVAVVISLGFLVYGGIKWITSGGDKNAVSSARSTLIASIVGLVIVFLSYVILNFVLTFLTGSDITSVSFNPLIPK